MQDLVRCAKDYWNLIKNNVTKETNEKEEVCEKCGGDGYIEIMGDGENFEWDVIGTKPCSECQNDD
jgi:hypothetical protein